MSKETKKEFIPGSDADAEDIFQYPFTVDENTIEYIKEHGRIMFIIRGIAGTGKDSLCSMLSENERFSSSTICSADHYFRNTFSSEKRDSRSLKESHIYCQKKVENACQKGNHPIIVKNTHVKKFEIQKYLDLAAEYCYTVIIVSTMSKFCTSPEVLVKSNTKGLSMEYFTSRLKQWQEIFPILVGWFISPKDTNFLLNKLRTSLDYLLGDGKFCRVMDAFEYEKLLKYYEVRRLLYCVGACSKKNNCFALKDYYTSSKVQDHYGECFTITIEGFLVTPVDICAIVSLDNNAKELHQNDSQMFSKACLDDITADMQNLQISSLHDNFVKHIKTNSFNKIFNTPSKISAAMCEWENEACININQCSFIHVAQKKSVTSAIPWDMQKRFFNLLHSASNSDGIICADQFLELEGGYKSCRLPGNAWILRQPFKITLKSIFTGLYV